MIDYKSLLQEMFSEVLESPVYNKELVNKYFSPNYVQHVDGNMLNFEGFNQHMKTLKKDMPEIQIEIKTLVQEGYTVFSNHIVSKKSAGDMKIQVIGEFRFQGDQICYCDELTYLISGDPKHRDLGSRI